MMIPLLKFFWHVNIGHLIAFLSSGKTASAREQKLRRSIEAWCSKNKWTVDSYRIHRNGFLFGFQGVYKMSNNDEKTACSAQWCSHSSATGAQNWQYFGMFVSDIINHAHIAPETKTSH